MSEDSYKVIKPVIELTEEEEQRRLQESQALNDSIQKDRVDTEGKISKVEACEGIDYLIIHSTTGKQEPISRVEAISRLNYCMAALWNARENESQASIDKQIWLCNEFLKAIIKNAKNNGKKYNTQSIKKLEQELLKLEKGARKRSQDSNKFNQQEAESHFNSKQHTISGFVSGRQKIDEL